VKAKNPQGELFRSLLLSAREEAGRRGDRRIGTEHLLLGLLRDEDSPAAAALGVSLDDVRARADELDVLALSAIGVEVESLAPVEPVKPGRRLPPLTSGARTVIKQALDSAKPRRRGRLSSAHFLLALLALRAPDPAAVLLDEIGVDRAAVAERLGSSEEGGRVA
jgi:ATP-dependent Clp protease ATP-binding subunit ClpA